MAEMVPTGCDTFGYRDAPTQPGLEAKLSWWVVLVAVATGGVQALQASAMGTQQARMGTLESMFITYGSGGLLIGLAMLATRGANLAAGRGLPWFVFTSGLAGLWIVGTIAFTVPRIGLVASVAAALIGQFTISALADHFGWLGVLARPIDPRRLLGIAALALGTWLVVR